MKKFVFTLTMLFLSAGYCNNSFYTSVDPEQCKLVQYEADEENYSAYECPSPKGFQVIQESGDAIRWLTLKMGDLEVQTLSDVDFGFYPNLVANQIEWRLDGTKKIAAVIVRISADDLDGNIKQYLLVYRIEKNKLCYIGHNKTNLGARKTADNQTLHCR